MGWSITILTFAEMEADRLLSAMRWTVTDQQVGVPVDRATVSLEDLMSPERQAANDPHFSAATGEQHFFVYLSLGTLGPGINPDVEALSHHAPLMAYTVVETSMAASLERWENGSRLWVVGGASQMEYEVDGPSPVDLHTLADDYRVRYAETAARRGRPGRGLPEDTEDLIVAEFATLLDDWFTNETGFRYAGDHPPLYRLTGDLPTIDTRRR